MTTRRLADLRFPDIGRLVTERSILLQPIGSVEQHGPHLPLSTDLIIAEAVGAAVVEADGDELDLWLLPALAYSKSDEHSWAPGSVWLSASTMLAVLHDLARSLAPLAARRLAFLNGHGGNSSLLAAALRDLRRDHGLLTFLLHPFLPADRGGVSAPHELGMGIHAGHDETSVLLHLRPELVDLTAATRNVPDSLTANRYVRFGGSVPFGWRSDDFGPDGHIGDPTTATADEGERLFRAAVEHVAAGLREVATFSLPLG